MARACTPGASATRGGSRSHPTDGRTLGLDNERDGLGDNLPPDYITHVREGGFYGWPWYYIGGHQDPRHAGQASRTEGQSDRARRAAAAAQRLRSKWPSTTAGQFPDRIRWNFFAAEHGSWNRSTRTGYEVIRVPLKNGSATGDYEDFLTGFVTPAGDVWGRPVGVAVAIDGSLMVSDDAGNCIWRVSYPGK